MKDVIIKNSVYLVETSFGRWKDVYYHTHGIFSSSERAEEVKKLIEDKINHINKLKETIDLDELIEKKDNYEEYDKYDNLFDIADDFNSVYIRVFELDNLELYGLSKVITRNEKFNRLLDNE